jgi:hypothetical protein
MRVHREQNKFTIAALLVCLLTAVALSAPEGLHVRSRTSRAARATDHDHDHSLEAASFATAFHSADQGDGRNAVSHTASASLLPVRNEQFCGIVSPRGFVARVSRLPGRMLGRAPPQIS